MTATPSTQRRGQAEPLFNLPRIPWPEGTTWFAFRTWVALALAYYAAFFLELDGASSAGVCVLILAQPTHGMVLSKAIYRLAATIVGVIVAVILTALFPQDRTMLLASFAVIMALQTALGSILRDFRSYACILGGYTIAIISIQNIDAPTSAFSSSVNRVAAIVVGIAAIALTNALLAGPEASRSLISKLRGATKDSLAMALAAIDQRRPPSPADCIAMSATLMPLRSEISFATPEKPNGRSRARGARSALLGLFEMISASQAIGVGLSHLDRPSTVIDEALAILRKALRSQSPEKCLPVIEALVAPLIAAGSLSIVEAFVLDRVFFMIECLGNVRDGTRSLRTGWRPRRDAKIPVHQDWVAVAINAARVVAAIGIVAVFSIASGIPGTNTAILFTAVFVSLGAVQPDPNVMGKSALFGMPAVVIAGTIYTFFIFPMITGYPLFILALAPLVLAMCWFVKIGMGGAGLIFGVQTIVLISPSNVQTIDPPTFVDMATQLALSGLAIFLTFLLILPVNPARRRLRLALATGDALRKALADEKHKEQPRASLQYDRLAQFRTWQRDETVTLARRKILGRLINIGNLSLAVRRAWRSIDRARAAVDPALDARARKVLPSLEPAETFALASDYLAAAKDAKGRAGLDLAHAAAALYGTALVTISEARLLLHIDFARGKP